MLWPFCLQKKREETKLQLVNERASLQQAPIPTI